MKLLLNIAFVVIFSASLSSCEDGVSSSAMVGSVSPPTPNTVNSQTAPVKMAGMLPSAGVSAQPAIQPPQLPAVPASMLVQINSTTPASVPVGHYLPEHQPQPIGTATPQVQSIQHDQPVGTVGMMTMNGQDASRISQHYPDHNETPVFEMKDQHGTHMPADASLDKINKTSFSMSAQDGPDDRMIDVGKGVIYDYQRGTQSHPMPLRENQPKGHYDGPKEVSSKTIGAGQNNVLIKVVIDEEPQQKY